MKQRDIYIVIASSLLILFCLVYQGTYSYFSGSVKDERIDGSSASMTTADLKDLTVIDGSDADVDFWIPGDQQDYTFQIDNPSSPTLCVQLIWTNVTNTWVHQTDLVFSLKDSKGTVYVENHPFPSTDDTILIDSLPIPGNTKETYTLTISYINTSAPQEEDMNKKFQATISAKMTNCKAGGELIANNTPFPDNVFANVGKTDNSGNGLYKVTNNLDGWTKEELRYAGPSPDNYVNFNGEKWRIIGLVNVQTTDGTITQRLKITTSKVYNTLAWDSAKGNDWTKATLKNTLNGDYLSSIEEPSKSLIATDIRWNTGGYNVLAGTTTSQYYQYERKNKTYMKAPYYWENPEHATVALMYPSDYGYATSGGETSRTTCIETGLNSWGDELYKADCAENDWLYDSTTVQWTLMPDSSRSIYVFAVRDTGSVGNNDTGSFRGVRPVVYLKPNVVITNPDATGSDTDSYELELPA